MSNINDVYNNCDQVKRWRNKKEMNKKYKQQQKEEEIYLQKINLRETQKGSNANQENLDYNTIRRFNEVVKNIDVNWHKYASENKPWEMNFIGASVSTKWILKVIDSSN
jgi:hypothetical protein